jgi:hypothetical protein
MTIGSTTASLCRAFFGRPAGNAIVARDEAVPLLYS